MARSEQINELAAALAQAQGEYKPILKNCIGKVSYPAKDGRQAGSYEFHYADLQSVIEATSAALSAAGLSHDGVIEDGLLTVTIMHSSGQWKSSSLHLPDPGDIGWQKFGSAVTYARRYLLAPLLGTASEDDDDANAAEGNGFSKTSKPAKAPEPRVKVEMPKPACADPKIIADLSGLIDKAFGVKGGESQEQISERKLGWVNETLGAKLASSRNLTAEQVATLTVKLNTIIEDNAARAKAAEVIK